MGAIESFVYSIAPIWERLRECDKNLKMKNNRVTITRITKIGAIITARGKRATFLL